MSFWIGFWTIVLVVALVTFTGLAVVVSIGGFFDLKRLFRKIVESHEQDEP